MQPDLCYLDVLTAFLSLQQERMPGSKPVPTYEDLAYLDYLKNELNKSAHEMIDRIDLIIEEVERRNSDTSFCRKWNFPSSIKGLFSFLPKDSFPFKELK